jgi:hypothetical protein
MHCIEELITRRDRDELRVRRTPSAVGPEMSVTVLAKLECCFRERVAHLPR